MTSLRFITILFLTVVCTSVSIKAQQYKLDPLRVQSTTFIEQLKSLRAGEPKMPAADFAVAADAILSKTGLPFALSFDTATCEKLRKAKESQKDAHALLKLSATLKSVEADNAGLILPEPRFMSEDCGGCGIEVPILQITDTDFITIVQGRNIKFVLPTNFVSNEAFLLDPKDGTTAKRKWRIPFRTVPIGISFDENVLFLAFAEPELSDLSLLAFGEGVFQIGTRTEAENGGKGTLIPTKTGVAEPAWQTMRFDRWKNTYLIKYRPTCKA